MPASDVSALPEVLGDAALLVNAENVFELARGIRQIVSYESLRQRLIAAGNARVRDYSWKRSAAKVKAAYESVVNGAGANSKQSGLH